MDNVCRHVEEEKVEKIECVEEKKKPNKGRVA